MIKKIHYCWIGSAMPKVVKQQVNRWKELCPDYDFVEWSDHNISLETYKTCNYWNYAYSKQKWAYVSDVIQFNKVFEQGGFYLDCDAYMVKSLSEISAPSDHLILGYMYDGVLSGGFLYAPPKHPLLKAILDYYDKIKGDMFICNNTIITDCLNDMVPNLLLNGKFYSSEKYKLTIYPKEYFCQPSFCKNKPFILDMFAGSWKSPGREENFVANRGSYGLVRIFRRKVNCFISIMRNEFRSVYIAALLGKKLKRCKSWMK